MRSSRVLAVLMLLAFVRPALADEPASVEAVQQQQALGWWLGGAGAVGIIAGGFALGIAPRTAAGLTRDLEIGGGAALAVLGTASLAAGIVLMSLEPPQPCEVHGTAVSVKVSAGGIEILARF